MVKKTAEQIDRVAGKLISRSAPDGSGYGTLSDGAVEVDRTLSSNYWQDATTLRGRGGPSLTVYPGSRGQSMHDTWMLGEEGARAFAADTFRSIRASQRGGSSAGRGDNPHFTPYEPNPDE